MKKVLIALASLVVLASCGNNATTETVTQVENKAKIARTEDGAIAYGEGPARVQIFADFQCPYCQTADSTVTPIFEELAEAGKITLEYRQLPLDMHPNAFADANAALCVAENNLDSYRAYKKALYGLEKSKAGASVNNSERIALADSLGITTDALKNCINNSEKSDLVKAEQKYAADRNITGTPTYYLDGQPLNSAGLQTKADIIEFFDLYLAKNYAPTVTTETTETTSTGVVDDTDDGIGGVTEIAPEDATVTVTGSTN